MNVFLSFKQLRAILICFILMSISVSVQAADPSLVIMSTFHRITRLVAKK